MPMPNKGESREDWMTRCMSDAEQRGSFPDEAQRAAVCESKFKEHQKDNKMATQWLRARSSGAPIGVDRSAKVIRGMVLAQAGPFKTPGRGEFDENSLKEIVRLTNSTNKGIKSRLSHPTESNDGVGKMLGRVRDARMDTARVERDGKTVSVQAVRGDLHFDASAFKTPSGDLATYVMDLAESDPEALSSSLVVQPEELHRIDKQGKPLTDDKGNRLPPLWTPLKIHASDIVDTGDAVDGLLAARLDASGLPNGLLWQAVKALDGFFGEQDREIVESRCLAWFQRYLDMRYGEQEPKQAPATTPLLDARRQKMEQLAKAAETLAKV